MVCASLHKGPGCATVSFTRKFIACDGYTQRNTSQVRRMNPVATPQHNRRTVFSGGAYVANLMAELSRVGIAQRIQEARREAGLDQRELADAVHVHWRTVQNWESQKKPITPWDRLGELAQVLGVSRDWLIHGEHRDLDPQDALRLRVVDALRSLEHSQEDVHEKLDHVTNVLDRLLDSLSIPRVPQPARDTTGPGSASTRPH